MEFLIIATKQGVPNSIRFIINYRSQDNSTVILRGNVFTTVFSESTSKDEEHADLRGEIMLTENYENAIIIVMCTIILIVLNE